MEKIRVGALLVFALSAIPAGAATKENNFPPAIRMKPADLRKIRAESPELALTDLLERVSRNLLGRPYKAGPLGEDGFDPTDPDPLYRLDVFDCTTFLETVMANAYCLVKEKAAPCLEKRMQEIRYANGHIRYEERNHIPELEWLPNNVRRKFLEEETEKLFPGETAMAKVTIERATWLAKQGKREPSSAAANIRAISYLPVKLFFTALELTPEARAEMQKVEKEKVSAGEKEVDPVKEKFRAEMESLKKSWAPNEERLRKIPNGSILNLVRGEIRDPEQARLMPLIVHQGLVIQKPEGAYIRHAAPNIGHVSEQKLSDYLIRYVKSPKARGITVYKILPRSNF